MKSLTPDIWIFDGETVSFCKIPFTTRMTVIRLSSGELLLHSPIKLTKAVKEKIDVLGSVKYLIAPNYLHHLFLSDWQNHYTEALTFGTSAVIKKRKDLVFNYAFHECHSPPWHEEVSHLLFTGSPLMEECILFHKMSGVLIVTDLIENLSSMHLSKWQLLYAKSLGILAPKGKMTFLWRLSFILGKSKARQHLLDIIEWQPKMIVMSHGELVTQNATEYLKESFKWLF